MLHRVLAVHGGHAERRAAGARDRANAAPGSADRWCRAARAPAARLCSSRSNAAVSIAGLIASAAFGPGPIAALEREPEREPAALREPADDRLAARRGRARRPARRGGRRARRARRRSEPSPLVAARTCRTRRTRACPAPGYGAARQHHGERTVGIEVGEQTAEVALVGAVAVHQQREPIRARSLHDVRDQRHAGRLHDARRRPQAVAASRAVASTRCRRRRLSSVSTSAARASRPRSSTSAPARRRAGSGSRRRNRRRPTRWPAPSPTLVEQLGDDGPIGCTLPGGRRRRHGAHRRAHRRRRGSARTRPQSSGARPVAAARC